RSSDRERARLSNTQLTSAAFRGDSRHHSRLHQPVHQHISKTWIGSLQEQRHSKDQQLSFARSPPRQMIRPNRMLVRLPPPCRFTSINRSKVRGGHDEQIATSPHLMPHGLVAALRAPDASPSNTTSTA